jgi:hypothetical protein
MTNDTDVSVTHGVDFQGVTIWLGDGAPCDVYDHASAIDVRDWISSPLQRATTVARLRAIADMLDDSNPLNHLLAATAKVDSP